MGSAGSTADEGVLRSCVLLHPSQDGPGRQGAVPGNREGAGSVLQTALRMLVGSDSELSKGCEKGHGGSSISREKAAVVVGLTRVRCICPASWIAPGLHYRRATAAISSP